MDTNKTTYWPNVNVISVVNKSYNKNDGTNTRIANGSANTSYMSNVRFGFGQPFFSNMSNY